MKKPHSSRLAWGATTTTSSKYRDSITKLMRSHVFPNSLMRQFEDRRSADPKLEQCELALAISIKPRAQLQTSRTFERSSLDPRYRLTSPRKGARSLDRGEIVLADANLFGKLLLRHIKGPRLADAATYITTAFAGTCARTCARNLVLGTHTRLICLNT